MVYNICSLDEVNGGRISYHNGLELNPMIPEGLCVEKKQISISIY